MTDASGPPATPGGHTEDQSAGIQDKAQEMAGQAQEQAQQAVGKAQGTVREQLDQRSSEAGEKIAATAQDLRSVGEELRNQGKETPAKLAEKAAERTEQVGSYLRGSDADRLLGDIEDFGRRQPLAALAGGLVVGLAAARFLKASSRGRYQSRAGAGSASRELPHTPPAFEGAHSTASAGGAVPPQVPMTPDPALR